MPLRYDPYRIRHLEAKYTPRDYCERTGKIILSEPIAAKRAEKQGRRFGRKMHAYQCEHCNRWHIGGNRLKNRGNARNYRPDMDMRNRKKKLDYRPKDDID